jgi:hypothetical protein
MKAGCQTWPGHPEDIACTGHGRALRAKMVLFGLNSKPVLDICFFKKPMSPQYTGRRLGKEIQI